MFITPTKLLKEWGLVTMKSTQVVPFLKSVRVPTAHEEKAGRGLIRYYNRDDVIGLKEDFERYYSEGNRNASDKKGKEQRRQALKSWHITVDSIARIEQKLDRLISALGA